MQGERVQPVLTDIDRYAISGELGRGGMGVVYRAYEPSLERAIALKLLSGDLAHQPDVVARLRREAIAIARLRHPNIALLYEFGQADGTPFLAMEYVPGSSLRQLLKFGPLPYDQVVRILSQIGLALDYAHAMGIVHRDVKPSNILVTPDDHVVLIDFGLAAMAESSLLTTDGAVLGTPHYMSPEQADGCGVDARSDQYSLAAVAYEMLTGAAPFEGRTAMAIIYAHIHDLPPPPNERRPGLPAAVNHVLLRALAKAPRDRYPSVGAFVADLRAALAQTAAPPRPSGSRWRLLAMISLAIVAVVLVGLQLYRASILPPWGRANSEGRSGVPLPQEIIWQCAFRLNGASAPVLLDGTLFVDTLDGSLVALNAASGEIRWQQNRVDDREIMFGAPAAGSALVFVGTTDEEVLGLSPASGGLIWRSEVQGVVQQAPVLYGDRLVVTTEKGYLYLLRAASGQLIWGRPLGSDLGAPMISKEQILVSSGNLLSAVDMASGTINWEFTAASTLTTRPTVFGDLVLVGTERGVLYALRQSDGKEQWRTQLNGALSAAPAVTSVIFAVDRAGGVTALSADAKHVLWHFDVRAAVNTTPLLADGKLLFGASNGVFYALDALDGHELARIQLGGSIDSTPVLGEGLIYVRAGQVYALGAKELEIRD